MSKHTPGPLQVQKNKKWVGTDAEGFFTTARCSGATTEEAEANAKLYAAAPELLDAANRLVAGYWAGDADKLVQALEAAIAKAEGK